MSIALAPPSSSLLLARLHAAIDELRGVGGSDDHDAAVIEVDRAIRRLEAVKLGLVAAADAARVADRTGMASTGAWLARRTNTAPASASSTVHLAAALAAERPTSEALPTGALSAEHAKVIVRATEQLPAALAPDQVRAVEERLVAQASRLAPDQLRRVARRALEAVEPDVAIVDAHEDALLRTEETAALSRARLTWHDHDDGTTSGHFTVPTAAAAILVRAVQSMTSPRRAAFGAPAAQAGDPEARRDRAHQCGLAFIELLEHLPTDRLHGKVAATVVVTLDHGKLAAAVGAAGLDTGDRLSAGEVRRLACGAAILPAVLGSDSLPLDLGRTARLFSEHQRVALATRHATCAADGCDRPFAWCELHHRVPWSEGGPTNLRDAVPLCGFHHRRVHDPGYQHRHDRGGITFHRRT